jgi:uroporphyrinogen III methyltransferase/synthase
LFASFASFAGRSVTVYLVGAGPGDPGLLTLRGAEVLARADVVVHDRLAEVSLLDRAPASAIRIDVGKQPGSPMDQASINALFIDHARRGRTVVRLKGGDPFVFGRGGEEALALQEAGVAFEVVPGVTSAVAVPAYAGVPVTHRGAATSFTVVTGHSRHAVDRETNWEALAAAGGTIVILMGVAHRAEIASRLMAGGLAPATPVVGVHWGTRPEQRTVRTTLGALGETALAPPVTLVVGEVAALELAWFERRPLFGRRIVLCRASEQAGDLSTRLREAGAEPIELPTIMVAAPSDGGTALAAAAADLAGFDWVVFSSANAVERLLAHVRDARAFGAARIAAVGPGTAGALQAHGLEPDLVPATAVAEALVMAMGRGPGHVLLPRAAAGRDVLPDGLRDAGWEVSVVEAYRTVPVRPPDEELARAKGADAIAFTSSSTVTNFLAAGGQVPPVVVCIGPITAETARQAGLTVEAVAETHTLDGLVGALIEALGRRIDA